MGTTQPLSLLVGKGISFDTVSRWRDLGHTVLNLTDVLLCPYDGIVSERAWRANDEMLKSSEGMMFKAMRAEKRERTPKPAKKARKPRKKIEVMPL